MEESHTFKAQWKKDSTPVDPDDPTDPDDPDNPTAPRDPDDPDNPTAPTNSDDPGPTHSNTHGNSAGTGDDANILGWIILLTLSLLAMSSIVVTRHRRRE